MTDETSAATSIETNETTEVNNSGNGECHDTAQLGGSDETDETMTSLGDGPLAECADDAVAAAATESSDADKPRISWTRVLAFGLLPGLALLIAMGTGFLKWQDASLRDAETSRVAAMQAAKDGTIALLSYKPDTVEKDLGAARDRLAGGFRDSYTTLTHDVVIPGAKQKQISTVVNVPAVASVSARADHVVVLVFVNQTVIVGSDAPTATASSVKVTLDQINGHWLISDFTPV
ncbi:hypothetical protein MMAN_21410 [Mycobacterium mantenii]|uniref:Outer membrane protein n=3 Tax=Mycobacterium mantenii TaxID=560555 RepID=A0ABM7JR41_MYCNT|nr:hypothetical protein [Mycobacterium mantenii]BBY38007.1 hypothetical protein MMAN_21410 [Mycobacterium mantenii]